MSFERDKSRAEAWLLSLGYTYRDHFEDEKLIVRLALSQPRAPSAVREMAGRKLYDLVLRCDALRDAVLFELQEQERLEKQTEWAVAYELREHKRRAGLPLPVGRWETEAQRNSKRYLT